MSASDRFFAIRDIISLTRARAEVVERLHQVHLRLAGEIRRFRQLRHPVDAVACRALRRLRESACTLPSANDANDADDANASTPASSTAFSARVWMFSICLLFWRARPIGN